MIRFIVNIILISFLFSHGGGDHQHGQDNTDRRLGVIKGSIVNSANNQPMEYVSISVIQNNEIIEGVVSDKDGLFLIPKLSFGTYSVKITFMGFEPLEFKDIILDKDSISKDLGKSLLNTKEIILDAINIEEENPFISQEIDKMVVNIKNISSISGGTAQDALEQVPAVDVDSEGVVTLRGNDNVQIMLNGKALNMGGARKSNVDAIPSDMIDRIEVITVPSAKYDPDGTAGIINIILKKNKEEDTSGNINISIGERDKYNVSSGLNYFSQKVNIFSSLGWKRKINDNERIRDIKHQYDDAEFDSVYITSTGKKYKNGPSFFMGLDYFMNEQSTLSFNSNLFTHADSSQLEQNITSYMNDCAELYPPINCEQDDDVVATHENEDGVHFDNEFLFSRELINSGHQYKISLNTSYEKDHDHSGAELDHSHDEEDSDFEDEFIRNKYVTGFDYIFPYGESNKLEFGYQGIYLNFLNDLSRVNSYDLKYNENIHQVYADLRHNISDKLGLGIGARIESADVLLTVDLEGEYDDTEDHYDIFDYLMYLAEQSSDYPNSYFKVYPTLHMNYNINETQSVKFGYSKRVNRPSLRQLKPIARNLTTDLIRMGDANTKPEFIDKIELQYTQTKGRNSFSSAFYYDYTIDKIQYWDRDIITFNSIDYTVMRSANFGITKGFGLDINATIWPLPFWFVIIGTNAWSSEFEGSDESDLVGSSWGSFSFLSNRMFLPFGALEFSTRIRGKMKTVTGTIPPSISSDLAIKKSFNNKKIDLTLKVKDVFNTSGFAIDLYNTKERNDIEFIEHAYYKFKRNGRTVFLILKYNFGDTKNSRKSKIYKGDSEGMGGMEF